MCGRMTLTRPGDALRTLFDLDAPPDAVPRFNIAPTQKVLVVVRDGATAPGLRVAWMRWGLVPPWAKDPVKGPPLINARAETVAEKPSFRKPFKTQRALVPADGYYEWKTEGKAKRPFLFRMKDGAPFALAALWELARGPDGGELWSCCLLTTTPNPLCATVHDRMPVIVAARDRELWLDPGVTDPARVTPLLGAFPEAAMTAHPVDPRVGSPKHDDPGLVVPLPP